MGRKKKIDTIKAVPLPESDTNIKDSWNPAELNEESKPKDTWNPAVMNEELKRFDSWNPAEINQYLTAKYNLEAVHDANIDAGVASFVTLESSTIQEIDYSLDQEDGSSSQIILQSSVSPPAQNHGIYVNRPIPSDASGKTKELMTNITGASVVWNQLCKKFTTRTSGDITATVDTDGKVTFSGTSTGTFAFSFIGSTENLQVVRGHKYLINLGTLTADKNTYFTFRISNGAIFSSTNIKETHNESIVVNATESGTATLALSGIADITISGSVYPMLIDITAMLGSTIADYVNTLETTQAGSGIAWLKSYGFFTEDYYAYSENTIQSVSVSKHITKDSNSQTLTETNLDHTTLRGIFYLDNGELKVDGDIYNSDGSEDVKYEERAYASGDESLPDTITDGTTTVTKKSTPTTATLTPFNPLSTIEQGGTEEFVDYVVQESDRDVSIPVSSSEYYFENATVVEVPNPPETLTSATVSIDNEGNVTITDTSGEEPETYTTSITMPDTLLGDNYMVITPGTLTGVKYTRIQPKIRRTNK